MTPETIREELSSSRPASSGVRGGKSQTISQATFQRKSLQDDCVDTPQGKFSSFLGQLLAMEGFFKNVTLSSNDVKYWLLLLVSQALSFMDLFPA